MCTLVSEERMSFDHYHYVPCVRWKMGEYQAIYRLAADTKARVTPLIEVAEIGWDFELGRQSSSIDDHVAKFVKRLYAKWGSRRCFVDAVLVQRERMSNESHPLTSLFDGLREQGACAIPVIGAARDRSYQMATKRIVECDGRGVCVRISLAEAARGDVFDLVDRRIASLSLHPSSVDLVLDLGAPSFVPLDSLGLLVTGLCERFCHGRSWRTVTIISTSFPESMADVPRGFARVQRSEWLLYKKVVQNLLGSTTRLPTFGDYTISNPAVPKIDMRLVRPYASVRYTADDIWCIAKGTNVRDNGFGQYRGLCQKVVNSREYAGESFSHADRYIHECASGKAGTGNLTVWRAVGTNHHIERVVRDVSNLFAS
jgi:hypothetical protein